MYIHSKLRKKIEPPKFYPEKVRPTYLKDLDMDSQLIQDLNKIVVPQDNCDWVPAVWCATAVKPSNMAWTINNRITKLIKDGCEVIDFNIFPKKERTEKIDRKTTDKKVVEYLLVIKYRKRKV